MSDSESEDEPRYTIKFEGDEKLYTSLPRDGKATANFANGDIFIGEYQNNKRNGHGEYMFKVGGRYTGNWVDGRKEGSGVFVAPDGGRYTGEFKADKRHGQGEYLYPTGDSYTGGWLNGLKHGKGTYTYHNGGEVTGNWVNGQCLQGAWQIEGGSKYVGAFTRNTPAGEGLLVHGNGIAQNGRFEDSKWLPDSFAKPALNAAPPAPVAVDTFTAVSRSLDKTILKADQFEGAFRLEKLVDGAPNFRQLADLPVFGTGQPSLDGTQSLLEFLQEAKLDNTVLINLRVEPVVYVGDMSFAPRDERDLNTNLKLVDVTGEQLTTLADRLANRVRAQVQAKSGLHFYVQDVYAEDGAERVNQEKILEVKDLEDVRTLSQVYEKMQQDGFNIEFACLPLPDSSAAPPLAVFDELVRLLKETDASTAVVFTSHMGKTRATVGMVLASLIRTALDAEPEEQEESKEPEEEEDEEEEVEDEEGSDDLTDEELEARREKRREERRAERQQEKERKAKEEAEAEEADELLDPKQGQFGVIMRLVKALDKKQGLKFKTQVDAAIDKAAGLAHLRDSILNLKEKWDAERDEQKRAALKATAVNSLERYFHLITFAAYLKEATGGETPFATPYSVWVKEHENLFALLGTREAGALAEFNWE